MQCVPVNLQRLSSSNPGEKLSLPQQQSTSHVVASWDRYNPVWLMGIIWALGKMRGKCCYCAAYRYVIHGQDHGWYAFYNFVVYLVCIEMRWESAFRGNNWSISGFGKILSTGFFFSSEATSVKAFEPWRVINHWASHFHMSFDNLDQISRSKLSLEDKSYIFLTRSLTVKFKLCLIITWIDDLWS